ncbi:hypothetical protein AVA65_07595 [Salmonella enterica subsp. enterica serovar Minnesota]|nr:hypothetical protein [Salmonella enterica subsp. enterica serovar Minnesota]
MLTKEMRYLVKPQVLLYTFIALGLEHMTPWPLVTLYIQLHIISTLAVILLQGGSLGIMFKPMALFASFFSTIGFYCLYHIVLHSH